MVRDDGERKAHEVTTRNSDDLPATKGDTPRVGDVLADRYRLVRPLGSGGMGVVWEAVHVTLDTPAAVKLIDPRRAGDEHTRQRFVREAKAAAAMRSPNVVKILDYGVHEDTPYIAMELLEGESLAERLARVGVLPPERTLDVVEGVGRAIAKAHSLDLVHRDLKPDNVFICETDDGEVAKVLDFGIAKGLTETDTPGLNTSVGGLLGTPHYMSPEQLMNASDCDARADLWALALIVYECLLGRRAYSADSVAELAVAVLAEPAPVPSDHGQVPDGFDAWFEQATRRDPDARYGDVAEMLDALRPVLQRTAITLQPVSAPSRAMPRWAGLALVAGLGAAVVVLATRSREAELPEAPSQLEQPTKMRTAVEPERDPVVPKVEPPREREEPAAQPEASPPEPNEPAIVQPEPAPTIRAEPTKRKPRRPPAPETKTEPGPTQSGFDVDELEEP